MILLKNSEHFIPITGMTRNGAVTRILHLFQGYSQQSNCDHQLFKRYFLLFTPFFSNCPRILAILNRELMQKMTQFNTNKQLRQPQGTSDRQTKILIMNCFSIETNKAVFSHCEPHLCLTELNFSAKISLT